MTVLGAAGILLAGRALAPVARAELAATSPFMPVGAASQASGGAEGPSGPSELRGMMATSDGTSFCIYDTAKKKTVWVGLNETGHDFTVRSADADNDSATVDYQGRSMKLVLKAAKVASVGPAGAPGANSAITSTVAVNPTPAEEQRRLEAVAQEVRRRRMEREKALQDPRSLGLGPGAMPPPGGR